MRHSLLYSQSIEFLLLLGVVLLCKRTDCDDGLLLKNQRELLAALDESTSPNDRSATTVTWDISGATAVPIPPRVNENGVMNNETEQGSFITMQYAYDPIGKVLAARLTGYLTYGKAPGYVAVGFRPAGTLMTASYPTMGPADFVVSYNSQTTASPCNLEMHVDSTTSKIPTVGVNPKKQWTLYESSVSTFSDNRTIRAQFLMAPVGEQTFGDSLVEYAFRARGNTHQLTSEPPSSPLAPTETSSSDSSSGTRSDSSDTSDNGDTTSTTGRRRQVSDSSSLPSTSFQLLLSLADSSRVSSAEAQSCSGVEQHNIFAITSGLTLPGNVAKTELNHSESGEKLVDYHFFDLPAWPNGCKYGDYDPAVAANDTVRPHCKSCFSGFQGLNCSVPCTCENGQCATDLVKAVYLVPGQCGSCSSGHYGKFCTPCACNVDRVEESGCLDGIDGNGFCSCKSPWGGATCNDCDATHFGPNCEKDCTCAQGTCFSGLSGNGTCASCTSGFYGALCDVPCPLCDDGLVCDDGPRGSGSCVVPLTTIAPATPDPDATIALIRVISGWTMQTFRRDYFLSTIASSVGVSTTEIGIDSVRPGSVIVDFRFQNMGASTIQLKYRYFLQLYENNATSLDGLRLSGVERITSAVVNTPAPTTTTAAPTPPPTPAPPTPAMTTTTAAASGGDVDSQNGQQGVTLAPQERSSTSSIGTSTIVGLAIGLTFAVIVIVVICYCIFKQNKKDVKKAKVAREEEARKAAPPVVEDEYDEDGEVLPQTKSAFGASGAANRYVKPGTNSLQNSKVESSSVVASPKTSQSASLPNPHSNNTSRKLGESGDDEEMLIQKKNRAELLGDSMTADEALGGQEPQTVKRPMLARKATSAVSPASEGSNESKQQDGARDMADKTTGEGSRLGEGSLRLGASIPMVNSSSAMEKSVEVGESSLRPGSAASGSSQQALTPRAGGVVDRFAITSTNTNLGAPRSGFGFTSSPAFQSFAPPPTLSPAVSNLTPPAQESGFASLKSDDGAEGTAGTTRPSSGDIHQMKLLDEVQGLSGPTSTTAGGPKKPPPLPPSPQAKHAHTRSDMSSAQDYSEASGGSGNGGAATPASGKKKDKKPKKCKFCNMEFDDQACPVDGRSHSILKEERKAEKKAKKAAKQRLAEQLAEDDSEME